MENLYDELLKSIKGCVEEIPFQQLEGIRRLLVVAVNEEGRIKKFLRKIWDTNQDMEIVFVAQPAMAKILSATKTEKMQVLEWQGAYTMQMVDYVRDELKGAELDGFLFFCDQPVNLRNRNLMNIAEGLGVQPDFGIFSVDIGGEMVCKYHDIAVYHHGIRLYEEANSYIDLCIEAGRDISHLRV